MALKLSHYHVATPTLTDELDGVSKRIVFATRTAELRVIDEWTWRHVLGGETECLSDETLSDLEAAELLVPAEENELNTILGRNRTAITNNGILALVVMPTAVCQLGCHYCGQEHSFRWLSPQHQEALIRRLDRQLSSRRFTGLDICWFGAEPLAGMSVIRSLAPQLMRLASAHRVGYTSRIITNGLLLTDRIGSELVNVLGVREIDVTLDGVAEFHDKRRQTKAGKSTFQRIFDNLVRLARRTDLSAVIKLRSNIDGTNWQGVSQLIQMLAESGVQERIRYYVAPIHSWGNDADDASLPPEVFAAHEVTWLCEMIRNGFEVGLIPTRKPIVCLAVQPDSVLIDAKGELFNCTEAPYVPAYGEPNLYSIGTLTKGEQKERRSLLASFNDRVERQEYPCSSCRMLPVCGGACPKAWHDGARPCPSALYNIQERLMLGFALARRDVV